jgi:molybdopterin-guanine dinucleotide biosynthesis protein A
MNFESFILIGGKSSRMGRDKSSLVLNDKTFLETAIETLQNFGPVSVVGNKTEPSLPADGPNVIEDLYKGRGALSGIHAALVHSKSEFSVILACDYPFVTAGLIEFLINRAATEKDFDALAPIQEDGKIQPLCAVYRTETCRQVLTEMLAGSDEKFSVRDFLRQVKTRYVEFADIAHLPNCENFFLNVNTPEDFIRAAKLTENQTNRTSAEVLKMTPGDVERILEIQAACNLEGWSAEDYEREIYRTDSFNVTAALDGETVGYLIGRLIHAEMCGELYNIGVDPRFRRKKVGNAMLKEFKEFCASENMKRIYLEVRESNETAIRFYLRSGFLVLSKRKNFYLNPPEDAVLMVTEL